MLGLNFFVLGVAAAVLAIALTFHTFGMLGFVFRRSVITIFTIRTFHIDNGLHTYLVNLLKHGLNHSSPNTIKQ